MATRKKSKRAYPWTDKVGDHTITFELMKPEDRDRMLRFTQSLPADDVMFLRKDITQPVIIDDWIEKIRRGATKTVLAHNEKGDIVGYASLHLDQLLWTRHLGEIRVVISPKLRGIGLGRRLVHEMFEVGRQLKLQRIVVNMRRDQIHVQQMLERLGFKAEALLTDWLMDAAGRTHDLLVMSCRLEES
ncbi:MAG TPA: GNAT family N-acetyltransferase [Candidatus Hydrogenedentes bacterium]|nr:GNAT family N-acetyltransferase [Candidatus Hydrogenedentota bacterium]HNT87480.1 GNAT family N-acetyltransferase [Candidatus Hydrogenedentota bacterium]